MNVIKKNVLGEEFTDEDEERLNPSPHQYKVNYFTKLLFTFFCLLGLGVYGSLVAYRRYSQNKFLMQNQMAAVRLVQASLPHFKVIDPNTDEEIDIYQAFSGSWVLLNIWATWCPPCKKEMPSLLLLQEKFGKNLQIVALSVDDDVNAVKDFIKTHHPGFKVLWDKEKSSSVLGVKKYPETFLISPDGFLTTQFSGPRDWASPVAVDYFSSALDR